MRIKEEDIGLPDTAGVEPDGDLRRNPCHLLYRGPMVVRHTGKVYPCYAGAESFDALGDAREQTVEEIWNGPRMRKLRNAHARGGAARIPECARCASPRPRVPLVVGSLLAPSHLVRSVIPWFERAALRFRAPFSERRRKRF